MAFVTDQIKTEQTDPFICSMCKIRGKTEDAIKNHILQVHLSEHFAEVDTTAGVQNSLSQIFKECSDQKMMQNGDQPRQTTINDCATPDHLPLNGSILAAQLNTSTSSINSVVPTVTYSNQIPPMTTLSFQGLQPKFSFQTSPNGIPTNSHGTMDYITMKDQNGQHITIHNATSNISSGSVQEAVTYSVPLSNINGVVETQQQYQQHIIHTDTSNGVQTVVKAESEQPHTNGITVNYGGGHDTVTQPQQQQSVQYQSDSFGSLSDTSNDFVCAKCTFRTDKIDQLESHLKDAHPASCVSFLCKHCNFKASNSRLFNIHLSVAHGNNTERSIVYKGAVATNNSSSKGNIQITTTCPPTLGANGTSDNGLASDAPDCANVSVQPPVSNQETSQVNGAFTDGISKNKERLRCEICETAFFSNAETLQEHKDQYHLGMRYQCFRCSASFSEGPELQVHYLTKHNISSNEYKVSQVDAVRVKFVVDETNKKFSCDLCGMRFTTCSAMYKHKRAKHLGMEYKCHLCNYTNGYRRGLKSHYETKHKNEPYNIPRTTKGALLKKPDKRNSERGMEHCTATISPAADSPEMAAKNRRIINASPVTTHSFNVNNSSSPVAITLPRCTESPMVVNSPPIATTTVPLTIHNSADNNFLSSSSLLAHQQNISSQTSQQISILNGGSIQQPVASRINGNSLQHENKSNIETSTPNNRIMIIRQATSSIPTATIIPTSSCIGSVVKPIENNVTFISQPINNGTPTSLQSSELNRVSNSIAPPISCSSFSFRPTYNVVTSANSVNATQNHITTSTIATTTTATCLPMETMDQSKFLVQKPFSTVTSQPGTSFPTQTQGVLNGISMSCSQATENTMVVTPSATTQSITSLQQNIHSTTIPLSTFPSSSIPSCITLPTEPSPLPEAISEVINVPLADSINDDRGYGLHSLDNLTPISPTIMASSRNIVEETPEQETSSQINLKNTKSENLQSTSKDTLNSQFDWSEALALINGIPDTPYAVKSIEITSDQEQAKEISQDKLKEHSISNDNLSRKYSGFESPNGIEEASSSNMMAEETDEYNTNNSIVKMKESHNRFEAFIKKARYST